MAAPIEDANEAFRIIQGLHFKYDEVQPMLQILGHIRAHLPGVAKLPMAEASKASRLRADVMRLSSFLVEAGPIDPQHAKPDELGEGHLWVRGPRTLGVSDANTEWRWYEVVSGARRTEVLEAVYKASAGRGLETILSDARRQYVGVHRGNVRAFLREHAPYQQMKAAPKLRVSQPLRPVHPMQHWQLDIAQLPRQHSREWVFVVIDIFSKMVWATALDEHSADTLAATMEGIWLREGCPQVLQGDNEFDSDAIRALCARYGVDLRITRSYRPQGNGCVERMNRTLKNMLWRMMLLWGIAFWPDALPAVVAAYNNTVHRTTKRTPHFVHRGRDRPRVDPSVTRGDVEAVRASVRAMRVEESLIDELLRGIEQDPGSAESVLAEVTQEMFDYAVQRPEEALVSRDEAAATAVPGLDSSALGKLTEEVVAAAQKQREPVIAQVAADIDAGADRMLARSGSKLGSLQVGARVRVATVALSSYRKAQAGRGKSRAPNASSHLEANAPHAWSVGLYVVVAARLKDGRLPIYDVELDGAQDRQPGMPERLVDLPRAQMQHVADATRGKAGVHASRVTPSAVLKRVLAGVAVTSAPLQALRAMGLDGPEDGLGAPADPGVPLPALVHRVRDGVVITSGAGQLKLLRSGPGYVTEGGAAAHVRATDQADQYLVTAEGTEAVYQVQDTARVLRA